MRTHTLHATRETCHATFSARTPPAIAIDPGDSISILGIPDVAWGLEPPTSTTSPRRKMQPRDGAGGAGGAGPCVCGPIEVRGARAGDTLAVRIVEVATADWGFTWAGGRDTPDPALNESLGVADEPLALLRWRLDHGARTATNQHGHRVRIDPFPGTIGLAHAPEFEGHSAWRPRRTGGNMDCRHLIAGSTLLLPIEADGALLSLGDTHAAQGDGECAGMAIETMGARITLACALAEPSVPIDGPVALAPAGLITMGFGPTIDRAVPVALNALIDILEAALGLPRADTLALASTCAHVHTTQLVNGVVGAHALLPEPFIADNAPGLPARLGL